MNGMQTEFLKGFAEFFRDLIHKPAAPSVRPAAPAPAAPQTPRPACTEAPPASPGPAGCRDIALERRGRELAARIGCPKLANSLVVRWSSRLTTTAGLAHPQARKITLNPRLKEISAQEVERTFLHELAHLAAHERHPSRRIKAHGPEWRRACSDLGIPGESVRHNLPFERRRLERRFFYVCPNCGKRIGRVRQMRRPAACAECCKRHNGGRFDRRFVFLPAPADPAAPRP